MAVLVLIGYAVLFYLFKDIFQVPLLVPLLVRRLLQRRRNILLVLLEHSLLERLVARLVNELVYRILIPLLVAGNNIFVLQFVADGRITDDIVIVVVYEKRVLFVMALSRFVNWHLRDLLWLLLSLRLNLRPHGIKLRLTHLLQMLPNIPDRLLINWSFLVIALTLLATFTLAIILARLRDKFNSKELAGGNPLLRPDVYSQLRVRQIYQLLLEGLHDAELYDVDDLAIQLYLWINSFLVEVIILHRLIDDKIKKLGPIVQLDRYF